MADLRKYATDLDLQGNSILNGGFEQVAALPLLGYDGQTVSFRGKLYTWYNGKWNCVADDLGGVEETREEQFTFQPTANDESVKDGLAIVKSIKGNTVVANQRCPCNSISRLPLIIQNNDMTVDYSNEVFIKNTIKNITSSVYRWFNFADSNTYALSRVYGHKYYISWVVKNETSLTFGTRNNSGYANIALIKPNTNFEKISEIFTETYEYNPFFAVFSTKPIIPADYEGQSLYIKSAICIDLTQMFGAGNEPTIEDFEKLYPNLPKNYNSGSLLDLNADSIKSVGFNAFNGNYAEVLGGMQYYLGGNITSLIFKENLEDEGVSIEIPSDNLYSPATNGYLVAEGSDICINLSHSGYRNGEYENYKESIVNLPIKDYFPDGMKSAGAIKDEIVWDGEKYKAIKRIGSVDMGTLQWREFTAFEAFTSDSLNSIIPHRHVNLVTPKYKHCSNSQFQIRPFVDKLITTNESGTIMLRDYSITTLSEFTTSIAGQILYYELETPIETIIDDYDLIDYEVSDFGTEEIVADEPTTPIIADIQYGFNAVDEIRNHRFEIRDLKKLLSRGLNLNGVTVNLGDTATIPAYITYNDALYPMRIQGNWLQIYRNGVWGDLFNLASEVIPSSYIEEFEGDWYNPNILEYILSDELTTQLISGKLDFRSIFSSITGFAGVKLSLQTFSPKEYDKSLDNILNAVTGYVVYVENDIDTMFNSGNNVLVKLNFDRMNRVTTECYIHR